jgi:hypothetical protein
MHKTRTTELIAYLDNNRECLANALKQSHSVRTRPANEATFHLLAA